MGKNRMTTKILFWTIPLWLMACSSQKKVMPTAKDTTQTWAEKLGWPRGSKVLILHADDIGMCEEANTAAERMLTNNEIQSAAVMVPCPNAKEFLEWANDHSELDIGLHLTLTSEWKTYRWGPITDKAQVPGLLDGTGHFWHEVPQVVAHASPEEVEQEIRAQIRRSIAWGHRPSHIDTHMGTLYGSTPYVQVFLKVAMEYGIPANAIDMSNPMVVAGFKAQGYPIDSAMIRAVRDYTLPKLDFFGSVPSAKTYPEKLEKFKETVRNFPPGLTEIIFHPSDPSDHLKTITNSWQQRAWEAQMFNDPMIKEFFKEEGIVFTDWKEIMARFGRESTKKH